MSLDVNAEKVSVNINVSTLSSIDLLVDGGYYSNRSDFINQALRSAIQQQPVVERLIESRASAAKRTHSQWFIGLAGLTAREVLAMDEGGETCDVTGYGVFTVSEDVDREKLYRTVTGIRIRGKVIAPKDVREHYGLR